MDIDDPQEPAVSGSPRNRIVQRLVQRGVPLSPGDQAHSDLVAFLQENKSRLPELVLAILPSDADLANVPNQEPKDVLADSLLWLQWMMFQAEPLSILKDMSEGLLGQRAVCGAVWGKNDLAYRCRTCEHDQTCAICVPCFQNGNHKDHDYSIIYTSGGCCDCGDATAWKREGFCSKHKGIEEIQPLPPELADSVGPVLDALFSCWKEKLFRVSYDHASDTKRDDKPVHARITELWTSAIADMLFGFCQSSESLLCLISQRIYNCAGLLQLMIRGGIFLDAVVVKKLHELLLKLLGDPFFKYEFSKVFVEYYPIFSQEAVKEAKEGRPSRSDSSSLLSIFSVQIFTVSSLTQRLVNEMDLLSKLLKCLQDLFRSCLGDDGRFQVRKWYSLYDATLRLVHDVRFTLSHDDILKHLAEQQPHVFKAWMRFLSVLQGMDGQRRQTDRHIDEENEYLVRPFNLTHSIQDINNLLAEGAFAVSTSGVNETRNDACCSSGMEGAHEDFSLGHQTSPCTSKNNNRNLICASQPTDFNFYAGSPIPDKTIWLIYECLRAIEKWIELNLPQLTNLTPQRVHKSLNLKKRVLQFRNIDSHSFRKCLHDVTSGRNAKHIRHETVGTNSQAQGLDSGLRSRRELLSLQLNCQLGDILSTSDYHAIDIDSDTDSDGFDILGSPDWLEIDYDVSTQEVSFHLPLHRFLSLLLRRAMKVYHGDTIPYMTHDFFGCTLRNVHPNGFASFLMEHPLHLRVFCAQVRAGMWKRNGDAGILCCDYYRNPVCSEIGIEADLFLLQCCAALSPPELFVTRILERFGLIHYLSLNLAINNEYEVVLVEEMLVLIIQIIVERRFCGLSALDSLQRELVCKLSVEDSTHSQLVYTLPPDLAKHEELQKVIDMVSVYKKPSGTKQGTYSLKKVYWKLLDIYHPRWDIRDLQMAEERFLNVCKISALDVQLPRWTEIFSPLRLITSIATSKTVGKIIRAVLCYSIFSEVPSMCRAPDEVLVKALHLLLLSLEICMKHNNSKVDSLSSSDPVCMDASNLAEDKFSLLMFATEIIGDAVAAGPLKKGAPAEVPVFIRNQSLLSLLVLLMKKRKEECATNSAYLKVCNIPSLVKSLLKSFAQLSSRCLNELEKLAPDVFSHLEGSSSNDMNSLKLSDATDQKSKARERQAAILQRMKSEQSKFLAAVEPESMDEGDHSGTSQEESNGHLPVCCLCHDTDSKSPIMILVLLQKSRISSLTDKGPPFWQVNNHSEKDSVVEDILHNRSPETSVDLFIEPLFEFNDNPDFDELHSAPNASGSQILDTSISYCATKMSSLSFIEALENNICQSIQNDIKEADCRSDRILANEKHFLSSLTEVLKHESIEDSSADGHMVPCELLKYFSYSMENQHLADLSVMFTSNQFGLVDCDGMHISSCGHAVHQECYGRYLSSLRQRYQRRLNFEGGRIVDPNMDELLCPVCRRFSNSALPVISSVFISSQKERMLSDNTTICNVQNQALSSRDGDIIFNEIQLSPSCINANHSQLHLALSIILTSSEVIRRFKLPKAFQVRRNAVLDSALEPILHKLSAAYSPQEHSNLPSSENLKLNESLMLWDTLRYSIISTEIASRGTIGEDSVSRNGCLFQELSSSSGHILIMLLQVTLVTRMQDHVPMLLRFEGTGLFASSIYPGLLGKGGHLSSILERDSSGKGNLGIQLRKFASDPIITHDPFSSLIWVLFCLPHPFISSSECFISLVHLFYIVCVIQALISCNVRHIEASNNDSLLNSICKTVSCSDHARNFFYSNFIDDSCNLKDTVRRLTFPYLRRSALLWRLLQLPVPTMSCSNSYATDNFTSAFNTQPLGGAESISAELSGIIELENMFKIGSPDLVYNDETVHALALIWCKHFLQHCRVSRPDYILSVSPAVPFKLMQLPLLYQDLLQRYLGQPCPSCHLVLEDPALCLLCGRLCSSPRKRCCRPSWCRTHATTCGSGIGVFLVVKTTAILLQRSTRQSLWPSPYLDAYGEEDTKMSRGKPLYLNEERYMALTKMVASHSLDQSSEVLRRTTTMFDL